MIHPDSQQQQQQQQKEEEEEEEEEKEKKRPTGLNMKVLSWGSNSGRVYSIHSLFDQQTTWSYRHSTDVSIRLSIP